MANIKSKLSSTGKSRKEVAAEAGLSYSYFSDMLNGRAIPNAVQIEAIKNATSGAVTLEDWVTLYGV